jgi:outer membrane protein assembly factor BamB
MHKSILLFPFLIVLISGCGSVGDKDNSLPPAPLVKFTPTLTLKTVFKANAGGGTDKGHLKLAPAFHEGQLFTASPSGLVRAFNADNGKRVWEQNLEVSVSGGPGVGEGLVVVGSLKGDVVALSETDGIEQWRVLVTSEVLAKPRMSQNVVVVRTIDGKLFGLDSQTGKHLWVYERNRMPLLSLRGISSPIVKHDFIIAGFDNGKMAFLELNTGKVLVEIPIAVPHGRTQLERMVDIDAELVVVDETIYVTSYQGPTKAIDLVTGKTLWQKKLSSYAGLGVDFDYLYVSDSKSHVWALDRFSGDDWWKQDKLQARNVTAPVSIRDYVVVGDMEGYLHWMRREDGQFVARYQMDGSILVPPLVIGNTLVAYNSDGDIVALRPETEIGSEPELESEPEIGSEPELESEPETELGSESELESEPETELGSESELEPEFEPELGSESELESELELGSELELDSEIEPEPAEFELGSELGFKLEPALEPALESE